MYHSFHKNSSVSFPQLESFSLPWKNLLFQKKGTCLSRDRAPRGRRFLGPCGSKCACTVFPKRSYVAGPFAVTSGPCALTSVCIVRGWGQLAWARLSGAGRGLAVTSSRKPGGRCRCSELDATPREGARGARPRSWAAELPGGGSRREIRRVCYGAAWDRCGVRGEFRPSVFAASHSSHNSVLLPFAITSGAGWLI